MTAKPRFAFVFAALGLVAACSTVSDDADVFGTPISESDVASLVAELQCDLQRSCDCYVPAAPVGEDPVEYTHQQCLTNRTLEINHWQGVMQEAGLRFDATCLDAKLASAQQWACGDASDVLDLTLAQNGCGSDCRVYRGRQRHGELCAIDPYDNCAQSLRCQYVETTEWAGDEYRCVSTCGAVGDVCEVDECGPGLFCRYPDDFLGEGSGTCQPLPRVGEYCTGYYRCAGAAVCDGVTEICIAFIENGEPCLPGQTCRGLCVAGVCEQGAPQICSWDVRGAYRY